MSRKKKNMWWLSLAILRRSLEMNVKIFYDAMEKSTKVQLIEDLYVGKFYIPRRFYFRWTVVFPVCFGDCLILWMADIWSIIYSTISFMPPVWEIEKNLIFYLEKALKKLKWIFSGRWAVYFSVRLFGSKHYKPFSW